jgi:hypothetical protein
MKRILVFTILTLLLVGAGSLSSEVLAQCAMCRATVENNVSSGASRVGAGLNVGILYLLCMPYLLFAVIGYFWYRNSKKNNARKIRLTSSPQR